MTRENVPPLVRKLIFARENELLDDDVGRAVERILAAGLNDDFSFRELDRRVRACHIETAKQGTFANPRLTSGQIVLGIDQHGDRVRCPVQWLNAHQLTLAGSGAGKTTRALFMALQIAPHVRASWLFDLRKQEFRKLHSLFARFDIELKIVDGRTLQVNPLIVPTHVDPRDWASRVADLLVQVLALPPRATKLLHVVILDLYDARGVLEGRETYPTLMDLKIAVAQRTGANAPARQAIIDSLEPVLSSLGSALHCRDQSWVERLQNGHFVFELGGLADADRNLILNTMMASVFASRIAKGYSNRDMDLFISCDEAARLVSTANPSGGLCDLMGLVRGTGIGLDLAVQSADIAPAILSNTATKLVGRCGSARDYDVMCGAMGLTSEQRRWLQTNLVPGMFIAQVGEGLSRKPFVLRIPRMKFPRVTDPQTHQEHARPRARSTSTPDSRCKVADRQCPSLEGSHPPRSSPVPTGPPGSRNLTADEIRFVRAIINQPGQPSSAYARLARMSQSKARRIRLILVRDGFLREHQLQRGGRGRAAIVLEPLQAALEIVGGAPE